MPQSARSARDPACDGFGQRDVVDDPEREVARVRAAVLPLEPGDVAALLVDREQQAGERRRERTELIAVADVVREEGQPAEAAFGEAQNPVRRFVPREARQQAGRRQPVECGVGHPLTAPAVSPNAIFRCTIRKKITTGIAVRVDAAISAPQSVSRLVPRKYESQTVIVCFCWSFSSRRAIEVLVPAGDEGEDARRDEAGRDQRQQDPDECPEPGRAVDHRCLLEILGDPDQKTAQCPDRERECCRQVGHDHAGQRVDLVIAGEDDIEGDDEADAGQHLDPDHQHDEELAPGEAVFRERDRRQERERDPDHDRQPRR